MISGIFEIEYGTTPPTPASGFRGIFAKVDGWYDIDDAGVEAKLLTGSIVDDTIVDGVTDRAPSQNAVFDALALKQDLDGTLTALSAYNTNGFLVQTAPDTFAGRTILGTAGNISVADGDGIAASPVIDLIDTTVAPGSYGGSISLASFTVDAKGRLTAAATGAPLTPADISAQPADGTLTALASYNTDGILVQTAPDTFAGRTLTAGAGINITNGDGVAGNPTIASTITQYTDELAQDAIGSALLATATITPVYNDGVPSFTWNVIPGGVDHNSLLNYVADQHVAHTGVSITGAVNGGLGGGGNIAASRTLNIDWTNLPSLTLPTDRLDFVDLIAIYDSSTTTHKSVIFKDFITQNRSFINRAYNESDDFIIDGNGRLIDAGAGAGASVQAGTYGVGDSKNASGVSQMDTGTTATGRRTLSSNLSALTTTRFRMRFGVRFALEQLSNPTQTFTSYIGFIDNSGAGDMSNGAYFRYTNAVNGGRWQCVTSAGAVQTSTDSGVFADNQYHAFTIEINEAGTSVGFYIDGVLVATNTTNIPNGTLAQAFGYGWKMEKSVGTTQMNQSADWYYYEQERTNAR